MSKLIIHPGFHKTGTTALQMALSESRSALRKKGFFYPNTSGKAQHRAAWAVTEKVWGWEKRGGKKTDFAEWEKLERRLRKNKQTSIISSEFLSQADEDQLLTLKNRLADFQVQVIFTWRPLPMMLASSYQQYLKYGIKVSYEEWLHSVLETPGSSKLTPSFWKRNLHGDVISNWCEAFGSQNVSLIAVDESKPNYLYDSFSNLAGIPAGIIHEPKEKEINRSLTSSEAALLLEINRNFPTERDWDSYELNIRKGNIRALTSSENLDPGDEKLMTPKWALEKVIEINLSNVAKIKSLGINILGDIDRNDFATIPVGSNTPVEKISIATAARAIIGADMSSLDRLHGKVISKEFFSRLKKFLKAKFRFPR
jgi:hypothetical protein